MGKKEYTPKKRTETEDEEAVRRAAEIFGAKSGDRNWIDGGLEDWDWDNLITMGQFMRWHKNNRQFRHPSVLRRVDIQVKAAQRRAEEAAEATAAELEAASATAETPAEEAHPTP